jgi:hypothetical protein
MQCPCTLLGVYPRHLFWLPSAVWESPADRSSPNGLPFWGAHLTYYQVELLAPSWSSSVSCCCNQIQTKDWEIHTEKRFALLTVLKTWCWRLLGTWWGPAPRPHGHSPIWWGPHCDGLIKPQSQRSHLQIPQSDQVSTLLIPHCGE